MLEEVLKNNLKSLETKYSLAVKNLKSKESCYINIDKIVPSASIIKLFIMATAFNKHKKGKFNLNDKIKINNNEKVPFSIISLLNSVEQYTIKDLVTLMIIQSDNTAANVLIDFLGMDNINEFIKNNGFKNTKLGRKMMDFQGAKKGKDNYTSAGDVFLFFENLYNHNLIGAEEDKMMIDILTHQLDFSMMRMEMIDDLKIAHKTGDLSCLKHDAGIVYSEKSGDYIFVMFVYDAVSDGYARNLICKVSREIYNYFENNN
jgi:beta-lactamase class A